MKQSNLEVAQSHLSAAHDALLAETKLIIGDDYAVWDALSLVCDAEAQVRGEIAARQPERPIIDRRAS
jgi:hypothetical protein